MRIALASDRCLGFGPRLGLPERGVPVRSECEHWRRKPAARQAAPDEVRVIDVGLMMHAHHTHNRIAGGIRYGRSIAHSFEQA